MSVVIETTIGDITVDLLTKERPRTSLNFLKLCKRKYYNLSLIFSVQRNFIAQMGDPTGTGRGGDSLFSHLYGNQARFYKGEKNPIIKHTDVGTLSMVNCGDDHIFGSQFFITLGQDLDSLDNTHLVFGKVVEGMEIVSKLNETITCQDNRPYKDIRITHTVILNDPFPDPDGFEASDLSPEPSKEILDAIYIAIDENVDDNDGLGEEEIAEQLAAKDAEARAVVLQMVGDLPDADMAPPENVLFVCKLNAVTTSEDLMIIFSRFGKINSCEVIVDQKTGNSLQYAFIEFDTTKACEAAYFKMGNVLIDERRIHVDFSQSVSKIKWKGKGRVEYFDDDGKRTNTNKETLGYGERYASISNVHKSQYVEDDEKYRKHHRGSRNRTEDVMKGEPYKSRKLHRRMSRSRSRDNAKRKSRSRSSDADTIKRLKESIKKHESRSEYTDKSRLKIKKRKHKRRSRSRSRDDDKEGYKHVKKYNREYRSRSRDAYKGKYQKRTRDRSRSRDSSKRHYLSSSRDPDKIRKGQR